MPRVIGLDIGSFAVRAAELNVGSGLPTLLRFGQVALPPGAVRDAEVVETDAVSAAIRRLWREGGFRANHVIAGVGTQRVIVREADMPQMTESELATALQFEAQELIPIPVEEAILDFQITLPLISAEGEPRMRVLLAAAQRTMVQTLLAALEGGGLTADGVDPIPFALVRALAPLAPDVALGDGAADAIVCIGGGITHVVVHEAGVPRFHRPLLVGGDDITEAIARSLNVDLDTAESLKRGGGAPVPEETQAAAARMVSDGLGNLVEEIRSSVEFYQALPDALLVRRLLLTGGGSRTAGLVPRLQQQVTVPVEVAHPLQAVQVGDVGLTEAQLAEAEPLLAVPIGIALAGAPLPRGARRITLIPREVMAAREARRQGILVGAAVGALAVLLLLLWFVRGGQIAAEQRKAEEAEARVAQVNAQVAALQDVVALENQLAAKTAAVTTVLQGEIAYTRLIQEVATVMPGDTWLTSFAVTRTGAVTFGIAGFDHTSTARWLLRLGGLPSISGLWVPSSTKAGVPGSATAFGSTATLTDKAKLDRRARFTGQP